MSAIQDIGSIALEHTGKVVLRLIRFHATQEAIREIRRKGYGILNQKPESGWCVLVVNDCYDFLTVYDWLINLQTPEVKAA